MTFKQPNSFQRLLGIAQDGQKRLKNVRLLPSWDFPQFLGLIFNLVIFARNLTRLKSTPKGVAFWKGNPRKFQREIQVGEIWFHLARWNTMQFYRDYNRPSWGSLLNNQDIWPDLIQKQAGGFFKRSDATGFLKGFNLLQSWTRPCFVSPDFSEPSIHFCRWYVVNFRNNTVDGSEIPKNHLGCIGPLVNHGINWNLNWFSRRISEPSTVRSYKFGNVSLFLLCACSFFLQTRFRGERTEWRSIVTVTRKKW